MDDIKLLSFIQIIPELNKYLVNDIIRLIHEYLVSIYKIKYDFYSNLNCDDIWVFWNGEYTIGQVNCRGTRVWLKTNAATSLGDMDEIESDRFYRSLETESPEDDCNLRAESLDIILNSLISNVKKSDDFKYVKSLEEIEGRLAMDYNENLYNAFSKYCNNLKKTDHIFINKYPTNKVWVLHKRNEIINELTEVLKECKTKNVRWIWL